MDMNKLRLPSLASLTKSGKNKESAKLSSEAKFPYELDETPMSQHETYIRPKGVTAATKEADTLIHTSVPLTKFGDRADVIVPGEKLQLY
jgi:hypothetical protein